LKIENGKWKVENGKWKMENGKWKMEKAPRKGWMLSIVCSHPCPAGD
jgi:hypothetical protein